MFTINLSHCLIVSSFAENYIFYSYFVFWRNLYGCRSLSPTPYMLHLSQRSLLYWGVSQVAVLQNLVLLDLGFSRCNPLNPTFIETCYTIRSIWETNRKISKTAAFFYCEFYEKKNYFDIPPCTSTLLIKLSLYPHSKRYFNLGNNQILSRFEKLCTTVPSSLTNPSG